MEYTIFIISENEQKLPLLEQKLKGYNSAIPTPGQFFATHEDHDMLKHLLHKHIFPTKTKDYILQIQPMDEETLQAVRRHYFKNSWSICKHLFTSNMENTFANDQTYIDLVVQRLTNSKPIKVQTDTELLHIDQFIRSMEPDKTYYVSYLTLHI